MATGLQNHGSNIATLNVNIASSSLPITTYQTNNSAPVLTIPGFGDIHGLDNKGEVVVVRSYSAQEVEERVAASFVLDATRQPQGGDFGCSLSGGNSTISCVSGNENVKTKIVTTRTKTATAEKAKETDDRVVNLGLFVALLGVLSIVV